MLLQLCGIFFVVFLSKLPVAFLKENNNLTKAFFALVKGVEVNNIQN